MNWDESRKRVLDEFKWFDAHRKGIIEGHRGEHALIHHHTLLGYFPDFQAAEDFAHSQGIEDGDYAVQPCITVDEELDRYSNVAMMVSPAYA
jgi:hypothetical protein